MSTEFRTKLTDEWIGIRWSRGPRGLGFDWGINDGRPETFREQRPEVVDEGGNVYTWDEFEAEVLTKATFTFGEFGGTMEVGSGDIMTYLGFD